MSEGKKTALYEEHLKLKAKMVDFAGWQMPIQYEGIISEHQTVRNNVGIFDVSHMGEIFVSGKDSLALLQKIVPQDISTLTDGKAIYCQLTKENGGIVDDLIIYKLEENNYLIIVNASRIDADFDWILKNNDLYDIKISNRSDEFSMIAIQGPKALDLISEFGITEFPNRFAIKQTQMNGTNIYLARTGYTGEDGAEIIIKNEDAASLWQELLAKGEKYNVKAIGLGARDTLRLEAGMLLYGQDMDEETTPVEASLTWSIPKTKSENYNGKEVILSQINDKNLNKKLIAFKMIDKAIPRHEYEIFSNDEKIGCVTSGGVAPHLQQNIGIGYTTKNLTIGSNIEIKIRNKTYFAEVVKLPFYKRSY